MSELKVGGALGRALGTAMEAADSPPPTPAITPAPTLPTDLRDVPSGPEVAPQAAPVLKAGGRADIAREAVRQANPEGGRLPADAPMSKVDEFALEAHKAGFSWNDIDDKVTEARTAMIQAGHTRKEVDEFFGYDDPSRPLFGQKPTGFKENIGKGYDATIDMLMSGAAYIGDAVTHPSDLVTGLQMSSGGMVFNKGKVAKPVDPTDAQLRAQAIGQMLGDLPVQIVGGVAGGLAGFAAAPGVGTAAGAGFGIFALPAWLRAHYRDQLENGPYKSPTDFSNRSVANMVESFVQGTPGLAAGILGPLAGKVAGSVGRIAIEGATIGAMSAAIEEHLPTTTDILESVFQVAAMHGVASLPGVGATIRKNIMRNWELTGDMPASQVTRAITDPHFSDSLLVPKDGQVPPGSMVAPAGIDGQLVIRRGNYANVENMGDPQSPGWAEKNITTVKAPNGAEFQVNKQAAADFEGFLKDLDAAGYHGMVSGGGFNVRAIRGGTELSQHAFGNAIDLNPESNPMNDNGVLKTDLPPNISQLAAKHNLQWGGDWSTRKDPMHFQWNGPGVAYTPSQVTDSLLDKIEAIESSGGTDKTTEKPNAAGALGSFQITKGTATDYGIDYDRLGHDEAYSRQAARTILSDLSKKYQGEEDAMAIAYNAGPKWADQWIASGRKDSILPEETQDYLKKFRGPSSLTGLPEAFKIGKGGATDKLYEGLFTALQQGKETFAGIKDPVIARARPFFDQGLIKSAKDLRDLVQSGYDPATLTEARHAGAGASTPGFVEEEAAPYVRPTGTQATKDILSHVVDEPPMPSRPERIKATLEQMYQETLRPDHPLNKVQDEFEKGRVLNDYENPRLLRRMSENSTDFSDYGITHNATDIRGNPTGEGLLKIIKPLDTKVKQDEFIAYAVARWTMEKAAMAKETGIEYDKAQAVVNLHGPKYQEMFDRFVTWENNRLHLLEQGGILSKEVRDSLIEDNKSYIPGNRVHDEAVFNQRGGRGMQALNPIKEMKGSTRDILNPVRTAIQNHVSSIALATRNLHNLAFTEMTRELGISRPVEKRLISVELTDSELRKIGMDPEEEVKFYRRINDQLAPNEMVVWRDGKPQVEEFDDPAVVEALKGSVLNMTGLRRLLAPMIRANQIMRGGTALQPFFAIRNLIYDIPMRGIVSGNTKALMSLYKGIRMIAGTKPDLWDEYLRSGAADYAHTFLDTKYSRDVLQGIIKQPLGMRVWNAVTTPNAGLQMWSRNIMSVAPAGRYAYGREDLGETPLRASVAASEFKLHRPSYGGPIGKFINSLSPFTLAHFHGLEQTFRALIGKAEMATGENRVWYAAHLSAMAWVTAPIMINWALGHNQDWYKDAPVWQKDNGLIFPVGDAVMYIPFPPLIGLLYGGLPRMLLEHFADGRSGLTKGEIASTVLGSLLPPGLGVVGGAAQAAAEVIANHSFLTGREIVAPDVINNRLGPERGVPWSSGVARGVSTGLDQLNVNLSPQVVDRTIQGLTGTLGKEVAGGIDYLASVGAYSPDRPAARWTDFPGVSSFFVRTHTQSTQRMQDFMDATVKVAQEHGSITQALKNGDVDRAIEILNRPGGAIKAFRFTSETQLDLAGSLTPADRTKWQSAYTKALTPATLQAAQQYMNATKIIATDLKTAKEAEHDKRMSPMDKRQVQDKAYAHASTTAEQGLAALKKIGL
jgi:hypothetical protein